MRTANTQLQANTQGHFNLLADVWLGRHLTSVWLCVLAGPGFNPMATMGGGGMGSGSMSRPTGMDMDAGPSLSVPGLGMGGSGGGFGGSSGRDSSTGGPKVGLPKKGMQLGKSKGASSILESLAKEEGVTVAALEQPVRPTAAGGLAGTHVISGGRLAGGRESR